MGSFPETHNDPFISSIPYATKLLVGLEDSMNFSFAHILLAWAVESLSKVIIR